MSARAIYQGKIEIAERVEIFSQETHTLFGTRNTKMSGMDSDPPVASTIEDAKTDDSAGGKPREVNAPPSFVEMEYVYRLTDRSRPEFINVANFLLQELGYQVLRFEEVKP
jgi:hypothetical protein